MLSASVSQQAQPAAEMDGRLLVDGAFAKAFTRAGLVRLDDLFDLEGGKRLDKASLPSWRERVRFELPGTGPLYLKRYARVPVGVQLRRILFGRAWQSTARIEWERMNWLAAAGIEAVKPVALGQEMTGPWERRSAVVSAAVPGESLERTVGRGPWQRAPEELIRSLAGFVARFHAAGYIHRDLYLSHIFVDTRGGQPRFCLIDLTRVIKPRWRRGRWIVKELASLDYSTPPRAATTTDRLRFLKAYLGVRRLGRAERRLVRRVFGKTRRIARHEARRRRTESTKP
ncbi:MAG: lipopolysaccharide kinase InaA family protein [Planctomycetota bacterium]